MKIATGGNVYFPSHDTTGSAANAFLDSGTGELLRSTSSRRYKENITHLDFDSSEIFNLKTVSFNDKKTKQRFFGLIAEEVSEVLPALVEYNKEGVPESVKYPLVGVLLIEEMKKLKAEIESLKQQL